MHKKSSVYLGFRGNITVFQQASIFDEHQFFNSDYRNTLFIKSFNELQNSIGFPHKGHEYFLYLVEYFEGVVHCKLARKKIQTLRNLGLKDIEERDIEDFPYINIFVDEKTQKLLIQQNKSIFSDYMVCKDILEHILNHVLKEYNSSIDIEPISDKSSFWSHITDSDDLYEVELMLSMPNALFGAEDAASDFVKSVNEKTGADKVNLKVENKNGLLKVCHEDFDNYLDYIEVGEGAWKMRYKNKNGEYKVITSFESCKRIYLPLTNKQISDGLLDHNILIQSFDDIENIEKFKRR